MIEKTQPKKGKMFFFHIEVLDPFVGITAIIFYKKIQILIYK